MDDYFLDKRTSFEQHTSEPEPGLRVYKYSPDDVAVQIRGSRGKLPTYAAVYLTWQEVGELQKYLTALLVSEARPR